MTYEIPQPAMKYGVAYDPAVWGERTFVHFAEFSWEEDAKRFIEMLKNSPIDKHIDFVVVEL